MCSLTLPTWVRLLQDANRETDKWKDECSYWRHKYHLLYREYRHILIYEVILSCNIKDIRQKSNFQSYEKNVCL